MRTTIIQLIKWYQSLGGGRAIFGITCNYTPSCSEYAKQAIKVYGLIRGLRLAIDRISRCDDKDIIDKIKDPLIQPKV